MLRENITAIVARNEDWSGDAATEPYEAGWAQEAVIFVRALADPVGPVPHAAVEISPDGMHWAPEGSTMALPSRAGEVAFVRVRHFGGWLRLRAGFETGATCKVLATIHLK
jgi:hypothetical protein